LFSIAVIRSTGELVGDGFAEVAAADGVLVVGAAEGEADGSEAPADPTADAAWAAARPGSPELDAGTREGAKAAIAAYSTTIALAARARATGNASFLLRVARCCGLVDEGRTRRS